MSEQVDANLVELARKWLVKMMPYRRIDQSLSLSSEECFTESMFFRFLLARGCMIIGITEDNMHAYLRCNKKLARFRTFYLITRCYGKIMDVVDKVPILSMARECKLIDRKPYGSINFLGSGVHVSIFKNKAVYLGTLRGLPLYLEGVEVTSAYTGAFPYNVTIRVAIEFTECSLENVATVVYGLEEGKIEHVVFLSEKLLARALREQEQLKRELLALLNEKYPIMDSLLEEVADIFVGGIKAIIVTLLY